MTRAASEANRIVLLAVFDIFNVIRIKNLGDKNITYNFTALAYSSFSSLRISGSILSLSHKCERKKP